MEKESTAPIVSIIIPVYNAQQYLSITVDSILAQTYTDFELLLIDDGSKDDSLSVCESFAQKDHRVKVYHKENGGVSSARNCGLDHALGYYIIFVDSDDYLFPDCIETMVKEGEGYDLLICSYQRAARDASIQELSEKRKVTTECICAKNIKEMAEVVPKIGYKNNTVWNQLFKKSIIEEHHLRFENMQREDELFAFSYFQYINSVKRSYFEGYVYYIDTPSSLSNSHSYLAEKNWIDKMETIYENILKRFSITNKEFDTTINNWRMVSHMSRYIMKGYYKDTRVPFIKRITRWREIRNDNWVKNRFVLKELPRFDATVIAIAKSRLYWLLDPFLILYDNYLYKSK